MKKQGFTLIELLVVIAVIGMLSSIVVVSLGPVRAKGRDARRQTDIQSIQTAMEAMAADSTTGNYPLTGTAGTTAPSLSPYLLKVPTDPGTGTAEYEWVKNDTDADSKKKYCAYAELEAPSTTTYFCASEQGTASSTTAPTLGACCF